MKPQIAKQKIQLYKSLQKVKPDVLSDILQHLNDNSIDDLCECVYNVIHTDLSLTPKVKQKLRKQLKQKCSTKNLRTIVSKKIPVSKRRKALSQEGAGLGIILATVVPYLAKFLYDKFTGK